MKILNVMLSREMGGIQQAFLDYNEALKTHSEVINIISNRAKIVERLDDYISLPNFGAYDIFSCLKLKSIILTQKPDIAIAHGRRAISLLTLLGCKIKIVGVAHNYSIKGLKKCDYIIALTKHMKNYLHKNNINSEKITIIPNMIRLFENKLSSKVPQLNKEKIIIGTIGRFVKKKGFDIFLQSLKILKNQGLKFQALIGGEGEEKGNLIKLMKELKLEDYVSFIDWVDNTKAFFDKIDIFCLPSLHEPFGIIILEAMASKVPVIATKTEGPSEIIQEYQNGLLCEIGSSDDLADKIIYLINNPQFFTSLIQNAYIELKDHYEIKKVGEKITKFLGEINK